MASTYFATLSDAVISRSYNKYWESAVREWDIVSCSVDHSCSSKCVCGKEDIKYLFHIRNRITNNSLRPIGSKCIKKFNVTELNTLVDIYEQMDKLLQAVASGRYINFDSELFSRKLITYMYQDGAFEPNQWNKGDPRNDYNFLIDMFNSRSNPTAAQERKIKALIVSSIKPYIANKLQYI